VARKISARDPAPDSHDGGLELIGDLRRPGEALVFEHEAKPGEPICGISHYRRLVSAAKRAEPPVLRFHDLRHSFGTQAICAFNIYEVQRMMGNRHITTREPWPFRRRSRNGAGPGFAAHPRRGDDRNRTGVDGFAGIAAAL
jgi:hypothetical protein